MDFVLKPLGVFARQVYCIGRNYAQHAQELGNAIPAEPVVFSKPATALVRSGFRISRPPGIGRVDHEVEIVVAIGGSCKNIPEANAWDFVSGIAVGIDVTARDLQEQLKQKGLPWLLAKGCDTFAPVSDFLPRTEAGTGPWAFSLYVNGAIRQQGNTKDMLFPIPKLVSFLSTHFTLNPGDLIYTGTPAGVGPLEAGDRVVASIENTKIRLEMEVV
ncbi:fumarylacetoacetate hydrolase family protein [bacterium]|nr:fumarylacetoacetate hydrolase family protein [bacterium]